MSLTSREALDSLKTPFVNLVLQDQECFQSEKGYEALLELLPADKGESIHCNQLMTEIIGELRTKWQASPDSPSLRKWQDIQAAAHKVQSRNPALFVSFLAQS